MAESRTSTKFLMKKYTKQCYHDIAALRGFKWAGKELPRNTKCKTIWLCKENHLFESMYNSIQQGRGCPLCKNKKTKQDYHNLAKSKKFEWVGKTLPTDVKIKTHWRCHNGYVFESSYKTVRLGYGCSLYATNRRKTEEDYHKLAKSRNFRWIGLTLPNNTGHKTDWVCNNNHKFKARYNHIQKGHGCRFCYYENNKGSNNPSWDPKLTNKDRVDRRRILGYKEWRYAIKRRDNFTCCVCGDNKGGNLVSHHLESYRANPELRMALDNGICLCKKCHKKFHSIYGYGNNTKEQFEDFERSLAHPLH